MCVPCSLFMRCDRRLRMDAHYTNIHTHVRVRVRVGTQEIHGLSMCYLYLPFHAHTAHCHGCGTSCESSVRQRLSLYARTRVKHTRTQCVHSTDCRYGAGCQLQYTPTNGKRAVRMLRSTRLAELNARAIIVQRIT